MTRYIRFLLIVFLGCLAIAQAQNWDAQPGFIDFTTLGLFQGEKEKVEIFLDGNLLKMVAEATRDQDPELAAELQNLQLIQVKGYAMRQDLIDPVSNKITTIITSLERDGWKPAAKMRMKKDDQVHVYMKTSGGKCVGIIALVMDTEKMMFVNIVGSNINTARLGKLGKKFNIDSLKDMQMR